MKDQVMGSEKGKRNELKKSFARPIQCFFNEMFFFPTFFFSISMKMITMHNVYCAEHQTKFETRNERKKGPY